MNYIRYRQACFLWIAKGQHFFGFIIQVAAMLIAKVGGGLFIANHFTGVFTRTLP